MRAALWALFLSAVAAGALLLQRGPRPATPSQPALDARDQALFLRNSGAPDDPELRREYDAIDAAYYDGRLPRIRIRWDAGISSARGAVPGGLVIEGLWLSSGGQAMILLNPDLKMDAAQRTRTLCHEMVHEYLFTKGITSVRHGPAFQKELRRLSEAGAFEGIVASDEDKAQMRQWLDSRRAELDSLGLEIKGLREDLDARQRRFDSMNARIRAANAAGSGWPDRSEIDAVQGERNRAAAAYDERVRYYNSLVEGFNQNVGRYNLMVSYPDGLDEARVYRTQPAVDTAAPPPQ